MRKFAAAFLAKGLPLHLLINNAGFCNLFAKEIALTPAGIEDTFAANHLGPFLLTNLLLDKVKASAPSRIINLSSNAHGFAEYPIDLDDINHTKQPVFKTLTAYSHAKLANILHARELAERLRSLDVHAVSVHPGAVRTQGVQKQFESTSAYESFVEQFNVSPIDVTHGAATTIYTALSDDPAILDHEGNYFDEAHVEEVNGFPRHDPASIDLQRRLWAVSEKLTAEK